MFGHVVLRDADQPRDFADVEWRVHQQADDPDPGVLAERFQRDDTVRIDRGDALAGWLAIELKASRGIGGIGHRPTAQNRTIGRRRQAGRIGSKVPVTKCQPAKCGGRAQPEGERDGDPSTRSPACAVRGAGARSVRGRLARRATRNRFYRRPFIADGGRTTVLRQHAKRDHGWHVHCCGSRESCAKSRSLRDLECREGRGRLVAIQRQDGLLRSGRVRSDPDCRADAICRGYAGHHDDRHKPARNRDVHGACLLLRRSVRWHVATRSRGRATCPAGSRSRRARRPEETA